MRCDGAACARSARARTTFAITCRREHGEPRRAHTGALPHIEAELGEGGVGVVYRATDEKLRRQVALKVLPDSFAQSEDRRRRFLREARSAAAVTHANIATVYEADEAEGHVYIAIERRQEERERDVLEQKFAELERRLGSESR